MVRRNVAVLLLVLASVGIASDAVAQSADPRSVVDAFQVARNRRDLDGAMELLADDVTVIDTNSRALTSKDEIRRFLQSTFWRGRFVIVSNEQVEGTHVSWNERMAWNERVGGQLFNRTEFRGDAIVQDGKI